MREEAIYTAGVVTSWSGVASERSPYITIGEGGELLACSVRGGEMRNVGVEPPHRPPGGATRREAIWADRGNVDRRLRLMTDKDWDYGAWESGVGAIDEGGHAILTLLSGRFVVLLPQGDKKPAVASPLSTRLSTPARPT